MKIVVWSPLAKPAKIIVSNQGPQGPKGDPGEASKVLTVTGSTSIPAGQNYTVVNALIDTVQMLPPISSVLISGRTQTYTVINISTGAVSIVPYGTDTIINGSQMEGQHDSFTFVATDMGWAII